MKVIRLTLDGVQKSFGATAALRGVSLGVGEGEVHALIGENGAGKSTLMKILSGAHEADAGRIALDGAPFAPRNPHEARRAGVAMIYQELNLAPDLTVAENIVLGAEPSRLGWLRRGAMRDTARRALAELGHGDLPPDAPVRSLSIAEQQLVEIARALAGEPRVMIFDEPTSSLTQADAERLFAVIARLKARGVSVIYISHFLEECRRVCDRFTVLRDGESVGTGALAETPMAEIIRLMVGREVSELYPRIAHTPGETVLRGRDFRAVRPRRLRAHGTAAADIRARFDDGGAHHDFRTRGNLRIAVAPSRAGRGIAEREPQGGGPHAPAFARGEPHRHAPGRP